MNAVVTGDPDMDAVINGTASSTVPTVIGDPDMDAVIHEIRTKKKTDDNKKPSDPTDQEVTEGPQGFLNGVAGITGKTVANIPYGVAHGVGDIIRRATGHVDSPETGFESALKVPLNENESNVASSIASGASGLIPKSLPGDVTPSGDPNEATGFGGGLLKYVMPVVGDVASAIPGLNLGKGLLRAGPPELPAIPNAAQSVVDAAAPKQSMGAAASTVNVSDASAPLKAAIAKVDPQKLDQQTLLNHLDADRNGVQLTKGQANRDPVQFSEEQNRSTHPAVAQRLNEQNAQMTDRMDEIRRDASPTNVQNNARENGQIALDSLKSYDEPIRADIKAKYQKLQDANGGAIPIDTGNVISNVDARLKKGFLTGTATDSKPIAEVMASLRSGEPMDFESFEEARSRMAEIARGPDKSAAKAAGIVRDELERMPLPPEAQPLKAMADEARSAAAQRFEAMRRDPAYEAAVDDVNNGTARGKKSDLADSFLDDYALSKSAPKTQVEAMMSKLDEEGRGAVATHTLNAVKSGMVGKTGSVLPSGLNGSMTKYGDKLDALLTPETHDDLLSLQRTVNNAKVAPSGSSIAPKSGVIVRQALEGGADLALNAATKGTYGVAKRAFNAARGVLPDKFVKDALAPGAGIEKP